MKLLLVFATLAAVALAEELKPIYLSPPRPIPNIKRTPNPRITGGTEVKPHSLPYQVGLFIPASDGTYFCGGSLISKTVVVSAAHCGELSSRIEVILGAHNIREEEDTQVRQNTSSVLVNPNWDSALLENDIALLFLPGPVTLNENIQIVSLPPLSEAGNSYENWNAIASGWGLASDSETAISPVLREIEVPVGSNFVCNIYYLGAIIDSHLCTSGDHGRSTCSGDSGGPLVETQGNTLIGITSFGLSVGCEVGWPSVFTRVTSFLPWIGNNAPDVQIN